MQKQTTTQSIFNSYYPHLTTSSHLPPLSPSSFELAQLYIKIGEWDKAKSCMEGGLSHDLKPKDLNGYLKCQNTLLHFYFENGDALEKVYELKRELANLVKKNRDLCTAYCYYSFGLYENYQKDYERASFYLKEALNKAKQTGSHEDLMYALSGIAITYFHQGEFSKSLEQIKQIEQIESLAGETEIIENHVHLAILHADILCKKRNYLEALNVLWRCQEREENLKSFIFRADLFYAIGNIYMNVQDLEKSKTYFNLAYKSLNKNNRKIFANKIEKKLAYLSNKTQNESYDLLINYRKNLIIERDRGTIDLKSQAILLSLLSLFAESQGKSFSKEEIYYKLWSGTYNPAVHDNKIYVAIKRLRKAVEGAGSKPKYIFRSPQGYFFNKSSQVQIIK